MKIKIINYYLNTHTGLESEINTFIENKKVIDIKVLNEDAVLIMYEDESNITEYDI